MPRYDQRGAVGKGVLIAATVLALAIVAIISARRPTPVNPAPAVTTGPSIPFGAQSMGTAQVTKGALVQSPFTLYAVTRLGASGPVTPPESALPGNANTMFPVMAAEGGTGIWLGLRGGIGFQSLTPALDGRRHVYKFGETTLVAQGTLNHYSFGWRGSDGLSAIPKGQQPDQIFSSGTAGGNALITLVPCNLYLKIHVTCQPLSAHGNPIGRPVTLICQAVSPTCVFAQIPTGYSAGTEQMLVRAELTDGSAMASWQLTNLPPSIEADAMSFPLSANAASGPIKLQGAAFESEDLSGNTDFLNRHTDKSAGGRWFYNSPANADGHGWTGVPTIQLMLRAENSSGNSSHQDWIVRLSSMTPQWQTQPPLVASSTTTPEAVFEVPNSGPHLGLSQSSETRSWQVGVAYPGQQHWLRVDGELVRFSYRTESVTFHDAEVVHDKALGVNRLIWRTPDTETTPSGISVSVLNGTNGKLNLAWKLAPPYVAKSTTLDAPEEVLQPQLAGSNDDNHTLAPPDWSSLSAPGGTDIRAFQTQGYSPFCLSEATGSPAASTAATTIKSITLTVQIREQKESHHFHLLIPVHTSLPLGWNPWALASRYER